MNTIEHLAELVGFQLSYADIFGKEVHAKPEALAKLLGAMGYDVSNEAAIADAVMHLELANWELMSPPVTVVPDEVENPFLSVAIDTSSANETLYWTIHLESGEKLEGHSAVAELYVEGSLASSGIDKQRRHLYLPNLPQGYHQLEVRVAEDHSQTTLIVAPRTCYHPAEAGDYKMWGLATQLYSVQSESNWGLGDYGDLDNLVGEAAARGASTIGLNPLHPLYPNNPAHCSPYSPTSRCFLNTLYIDVSRVPGYGECAEVQEWINSDEFKTTLAHAKASELIDYPAVAACKYPALEKLFAWFDDSNSSVDTATREDFEAFIAEGGQDLQVLATFDALYEYFREQDSNAYGWTAWPVDYQSPDSEAVRQFQRDYAARIRYFVFLQWQADRQLGKAAARAKNSDMALGLYLDLAVGCDGGGAEVWADKHSFVHGAAVGAPPDEMNMLGQDWGLTPINPVAMRETAYMPFIKALRSNMRHAGALRIDHAFGLMRQYWVAPGMGAHEGVFITYPLEDMLRVIALESRRARCVVIGEDLGTTPPGFGDLMGAAGLLSYKVLYFERWESGLFMRPDQYPEHAMVTVSTHDIPTLKGWWASRDLDWREDLSLYPKAEMAPRERQERDSARQLLLDAMRDSDIVDIGTAQAIAGGDNLALSNAVQRFLARTSGRIQMIPMEDALGIVEQVNIPGTTDEHPNWRRKLPLDLSAIWDQAEMQGLVAVMAEERPHQ